jgi:hypothetical protein
METSLAGERAMLDVQREEVARLVSELDDTEARARLVPSLTTPLGLVKHATFVEKVRLHSRVASVPRADLGLPDTVDESFVLEPEDTVASVRDAFLAASERSREVAAAHDLDEQIPWHQGPVSLQFVYAHMIAEIARHAGEIAALQRHRDEPDDHALHLPPPRDGLFCSESLPVPLGREQVIRGDGPSRRALSLQSGVEVALGAVGLASASGSDPPGASARAHPVREISAAELGHDSAMVAGLDLEPDAVGERDDALRTACVPLFGDRLGAHDDRLVDLFQADPKVWQFNPKITEAALCWAHADRFRDHVANLAGSSDGPAK